MPTIRDIRVITCRPTTENLVVVRVDTDEPGLYGYGDATFTQRYTAVVRVVEDYLRPLLIGRDASAITELWRLMHHNGYWRDGPVLNNAISGVDMALWDIKGRRAGMPVHELLGGCCRPAAAVYRHVSGPDLDSVVTAARAYIAEGAQHLRIQLTPQPCPQTGALRAATTGYGGSGYFGPRPDGCCNGVYIDAHAYINETDHLIAGVRQALGPSIKLVHDVHSRLVPADAIALARRLERHQLFFLEDPLPPEQSHWLTQLRAATSTPIAIGELFVGPHDWRSLVERHEIDFIRMHLSTIGGITPAWRAAIFAEAHGVRTAWHCPKDIAPVGVAANLALDLACPNFGIQEFAAFTPQEREIFSGLPDYRGGYLYPSNRPGLGIEIDESAAMRFPARADVIEWTQTRAPDGSLICP